MPDITRIVERAGDGRRPTTILDLEQGAGGTYSKARDSFTITPPPKRPKLAQGPARYSGAHTVGEKQDNGAVAMTLLVRGANGAVALANVEALLAELDEARRLGRLLEWRPASAAHSSFFAIRGPGTYTVKYSSVHFSGAVSLEVELTVPVGPLVELDEMDFTEDFADASVLSEYAVDQGSVGNVSVIGGQLAITASLTSLYRVVHVIRGYDYGDVEASIKHTPGALSATYRAGCIIKRLDADNQLFGRINETGSGRSIEIFKRDGGSNIQLGPGQSVAALAAGTPYWLVVRIEGDVVTVEHWTSEPTPTGAPAGTLTYTLTGADATKFGANAAGKAGIYWVPMDAAARIDDLKVRPYTYRNRTLPEKIQLRGAIPGKKAPARADLVITPSGGSAAPVFALAAWARRLTGGAAAAPFGIFEAEAAAAASGWSSTADAAYRGGNGLETTAAGAGSATADFAVDPSLLVADDFTFGDVAVEVWARLKLASTLVSPKLAGSARPTNLNFGAERPTDEWGTVGKLLTVPSSGTRLRIVRVGTIPLFADARQPLEWRIRLALSWAAGSSGLAGLDYIWLNYAKRRALSPTSKPNDASYPKFVASTSQTQRRIRHDLSGQVSNPPANAFPHHGLGGQQIQPPPGDLDLLVKLSSLVPDDPTVDATTEQLTHSATVHLAVIPRAHLARS